MSQTPILFTIPNFLTAGSGQVLLNIASRLDRNKFSPLICVSRRGGQLEQVAAEEGIPVFEANFDVQIRPYATLPLRVWKAAQVFRPYRFSIWHSFHYSDNYAECLVAYFAGAKNMLFTKKNMGWGSRAWLLKSYLSSKIVVDNTDMLSGMFNRAGLHQKISYIPHGVDAQKYTPSTPPVLQMRASLGLDSGVPVIAVVAHLVPVKGHPTLLQALARVPDAHLWLAGKPLDAPYVDALKEQVRQLGLSGRVHFLSSVEDIPALLAEVDIAVLPTWARWRMEGCPVALLEAMACGKACVATNIPGARDLLVHGESGLLVPPEDPSALAAALQRLLEDSALRACLGQAARQRVLENFTIAHEVARHEALYAELLGARGISQ